MSKKKHRSHRVAAASLPAAVPASTPAPASATPSWSGVRSVSSTSRAKGVTPERLAGYLQQGADGDPRAAAEFFSEMEARDLQLVTVLSVRKRALAGLEWQIQAASDRRTDKKIAEFCAETVRGIANLRDAIVDLMDALLKGYAFAEIDWRVAPGRVSIARLVHRPAPWFLPDRENPEAWRILSQASPATGEPLAPNAWILHRCRARSGSHDADQGLGAPISWAYLFKNYAVKDWVIFAQNYGAPIRVGTYPLGMAEEDRRALLNALRQLGVDAAAIFPEGTKIELKEAGKTSSIDVYDRLVRWAEKGYAKAILGQTLTTEEGTSGSLALGQVHAEVRQDLVESDADQLGDTLTAQLIRPLVDFQFGPQAAYPRFAFLTDPPEDLAKRAELYGKLGELGVEFPVQHVHEVFDIPAPKPGEAVYRKGQAAGPAATPAPATPARAAVASFGEEVELAFAGDLPPMPAEVERAIREALDRGGYQGWEDTIRHLRSYLDRAGRVEDVSALLLQACETLGLEAQAEHLADEIIRTDLIGRAQVRQGELPVGDFPRVPPREAIGFWLEKTAMTPEQFGTLSEMSRSRAFSVARFTTLQAVQEVHDALNTTLAEGLTLPEFEDRYDQALRRNGMAPDTPWHVTNVYRTNLLTSYSVGRYREQTNPETMARRPFWLYDAVDDSRTRDTHAAMDGKVYPAGHAIWQTWYPPNGYQCRCGVQALTTEELNARGLRVDEALPVIFRTRPGGETVREPNVPDDGFRANPALEAHEFDFSRFPPQYRRALGLET